MSPEEKAKLEAAAAAISEGKKKKKGGRTKAGDRPGKLVKNFVAFSENHHARRPRRPPTPQRRSEHQRPLRKLLPNRNLPWPNRRATPSPVPSLRWEIPWRRCVKKVAYWEQAEEALDKIVDTVTDVVEDVTDTAKAVAQVAGERLSDPAPSTGKPDGTEDAA